MTVLMVTALEHKRSLASSQTLSFFLILTGIFDAARIRSFILVGFQEQPSLIAGLAVTLLAKLGLLALENVRKNFCLRENLRQHVRSSS